MSIKVEQRNSHADPNPFSLKLNSSSEATNHTLLCFETNSKKSKRNSNDDSRVKVYLLNNNIIQRLEINAFLPEVFRYFKIRIWDKKKHKEEEESTF